LVVADLMLGSIVLPRSETPQAVSRLAEFEWFHKIETENDIVTPEIDDLLLRAQKIYQSVDDVVKGLQIPPQVGIMEILFKGTVIKKKQYELAELESMISDLEKKLSTIDGASKLLDEAASTQRAIDEYSTLKETLDVVKKLNVDLEGFGLMRYFYTNLFVVNSSDFAEISRSLEGVVVYKYDLESKDKTALIVISGADDADRVLKVFRGFNANPFVVPAGLPQIPSQAYSFIVSELAELNEKQKKIGKDLAGLKKSLRGDVLALHESAYLAKEVLETLRKPGGTKRFAVIQGYIPRKMESKFKDVTKQWMSVTEDITDPKLIQNRPTLFENKRWVRTFEVITQSQGIPRRGEADPTPMISLMWPIFYGIMFADVGHGLLLMGLGLLFKMKGQGILSRWGMLIAISGASAAVAGVGAGEMFGFHIDHLQPFEDILHGPLQPIAWLVGVISVAELTFDQVINILKVSLFLGIIHLVWAFVLRIKRLHKEGHKQMMFLEAVPNLTLYGGIVVIMMCAIGSSYDVMNMYSRVHNEPVPWVTVFLGDWATVWIVTRIAVIIVIGSMAVMMVGGILHAKHHPEVLHIRSAMLESASCCLYTQHSCSQ
jgi:V/A-type H+/Na+-transporting ATPase subunit I